MALMNHVS